jgi:RNA polymerase sigma-70 factor, ECF subfamily
MQSDHTNSFNAVYTAFYRKSFLFVKSYVHDGQIAEDIVSESLIKLWERMKLQTVEHVSSYLFTILKNSALDHLKHEAVERKVFNSLNEKLVREHEIRISALQCCDPDEIFSSEIQKIIHDTLAALPNKSRKIFIMSRFENKSNKEIAEFLGITVKGVDYHIGLTLKALRVSLKDYLPLFFYLLVR